MFGHLQRNIRGLRDFVAMEDSDRRAMLRSLTDQEYVDIMNVCSIMPHVEMNIRSEGVAILFHMFYSNMFKLAAILALSLK